MRDEGTTRDGAPAASSGRVADGLYALALLAVGLVVFLDARGLEDAPFDPLGPKTFPIWIAIGLMGLSGVMLLRLMVGHDLGRAAQSMVMGLGEGAAHAVRPWVSAGLLALTLAYAGALSVRGIGFLIATGVYLFLAMLLLGGLTRRHVAGAAVAAVVAAVICDLVFRRVFALDLP